MKKLYFYVICEMRHSALLQEATVGLEQQWTVSHLNPHPSCIIIIHFGGPKMVESEYMDNFGCGKKFGHQRHLLTALSTTSNERHLFATF